MDRLFGCVLFVSPCEAMCDARLFAWEVGVSPAVAMPAGATQTPQRLSCMDYDEKVETDKPFRVTASSSSLRTGERKGRSSHVRRFFYRHGMGQQQTR